MEVRGGEVHIVPVRQSPKTRISICRLGAEGSQRGSSLAMLNVNKLRLRNCQLTQNMSCFSEEQQQLLFNLHPSGRRSSCKLSWQPISGVCPIYHLPLLAGLTTTRLPIAEFSQEARGLYGCAKESREIGYLCRPLI